MKMLFKQRVLSLLDSYDIYDENGNVLFIVKGRWSWTHHLEIFDANGEYLASIKQKAFTFLPKFDIYLGDEYQCTIESEFYFFKPKYHVTPIGWKVEGDAWQWDYHILNQNDQLMATVSKQLWNWSDTYIIDTRDDSVLMSLLVVLAIDCDKCSRESHN